MSASRLSGRQWAWLIGTLAAVGAIVAVGATTQDDGEGAQAAGAFSVDQSIKQLAPQLDVTGKSLARDLGLPLDAS